MKINKLQINDFGKISNREIEFKENINLVIGKNESGKSTIQKFILSMFYGIANDKRKTNFTDYDKFFPWGKENFSGKIKYTLDDGQSYEIYRDFTKKNPIVYNENAEDITKQFTTTKTKGSHAFQEQTGIEEQIMLSSMMSEQNNVVIDQNSENFVIQKLANMTETGDEKISYESAQRYLTKKRNDDVGTAKTRNKPINILQSEKNKLIDEKQNLEIFSDEQYTLENRLNDVKNIQEKNERLLEFAIKFKRIEENQNSIQNKVELYEETLKNNNDELIKLHDKENEVKSKLKNQEKEYSELNKEKNEKIEKLSSGNEKMYQKKRKTLILSIICSIFSILFAICIGIIIKSVLPAVIGVVIGIVVLGIGLVLNKSNTAKTLKNSEEIEKLELEENDSRISKIQDEIKEIKLKVNMLNTNNNEIKDRIFNMKTEIRKEKDRQLDELITEFDDIDREKCEQIIESKNINTKIEELQRNKNDNSIEMEKIEYRKKYIMPQLERYNEVEEKICDLSEREENMMSEVEAITVASNILENAYSEMKKSVIPRFTENLSKTINYISDGKYSKVITNDKDGLLIEKQDGEYIPAMALSMGTIDQLYLSLRIAIVEENTNQIMPIILDEAFAFFDDERLENILKYISDSLKRHQVIIFSCTSREREILEKLNVKYNLIEI